MEVKRGEIYYCDLGGGFKSEQGGLRPVLIVQNNTGNKYSTTTIVAAITTQEKHKLPTHVTIKEPLPKESTIMCEQLFTIDKARLWRKIGKASKEVMNKINIALYISVLKEDKE